jgi:protein DGCR14
MSSTASSSTLAVTLPGHSLNRQKVLEEEEYTAALSHIIARDFFPSLAEATNDFSDESRSEGSYPVNSSIRRLPDIDSTPALGSNIAETPISVRGRTPSKRARYDTNLSLDDFQARYTSEDNSSFTQILDEENRKRKERWAWAWDAQRRVEGQRMIAQDVRKKMLTEAPGVTGVREKFLIEASGPVGLVMPAEDVAQDAEGSGNDGQVAILETTKTEVDVLAPKKDTRSTRVDGWDFKVC